MDIPRHWRLRKQRYGLAGSSCEKCNKPLFPPRPICVEHTYDVFDKKAVPENVKEAKVVQPTQPEDGLLFLAICSSI